MSPTVQEERFAVLLTHEKTVDEARRKGRHDWRTRESAEASAGLLGTRRGGTPRARVVAYMATVDARFGTEVRS